MVNFLFKYFRSNRTYHKCLHWKTSKNIKQKNKWKFLKNIKTLNPTKLLLALPHNWEFTKKTLNKTQMLKILRGFWNIKHHNYNKCHIEIFFRCFGRMQHRGLPWLWLKGRDPIPKYQTPLWKHEWQWDYKVFSGSMAPP